LDNPAYGLVAIRGAIDTISVLTPSYGDIKVYPWAGSVVLDADPDYTYTDEVSQSGTEWAEVGYFDFDEDTADIKSIFYVDITDEVTETGTSYVDKGRSGVIHKITNMPTQTPFTIRCLVANVDATSAEAKIKSNSYIRVTYKRVSA